MFFDNEAGDDEDDIDEEEDDDEEEPGFDALVKETKERESAHRHRDLYNQLEQDDDAANLADYFKKRYSKNNDSDRFGSSDQLSGTIIQKKLLPGVRCVSFIFLKHY